MERVSNAGNGIYSLITSQEQASRYAEERMLSTLRYVAKDLKIQLEWNPEQVEAYRLIGYEDRAIADSSFRDDAVDAGEVGAGHRVTALYEVVRKGGQVPAPAGAPAAESGEPVAGDREVEAGELVRVKVRYKLPNAAENDPASEVVQKLAPSEIGGLFDSADEDLRWAAAIAAYAELLKHSPYAVPSAREQLRTVFAAQAERDFARMEFLKLFDAAAAL
jgi:Ca-activated chloride channel family protein